MTVGDENTINTTFRQFHAADDFRVIIDTFNRLCGLLSGQISYSDRRSIYESLRNSVTTNESVSLWRLLDARAAQSVYRNQNVCRGMRVLVVGGGPCGLRMAMECALLGAHVVLVEQRDYNSRFNVLHLWPVVIHDLKTVGAKVFYPKFCSGNREHISIQRLQAILLKLALVLGVEVHAPVSYEDIIEPGLDVNGKDRGWRVKVYPAGHVVENYDFDVIIGADGKRNSLKVFKHKVFRGRLALGITANLENAGTTADNMAQEIGGVFYVYYPEFFDKLKEIASIDLENFVYFKDDTHYFVMTAKKKSLLKKGVLKNDFADVKKLLSENNIDRNKLAGYAREAIDISTDNVLAERPFSQNHRGQEDVALFDFTALQQADNSSMAAEVNGRRLLLSIVGDTLIEPFWPTGSGVARGFLSVFDTAWLLRGWGLGETPGLGLLAERESIYSLLSQTRPDNLKRNMTAYSIDPTTRYDRSLKGRLFRPEDVRHLWVTSDLKGQQGQVTEVVPERPSVKKRRLEGENREKELIKWYQRHLAAFSDIPIQIMDLTSSWSSGLALSAVLTLFRPELINVRRLNPKDAITNVEKAYRIILREFGISPVLSAQLLVTSKNPDKLAMMSYLTQLRHAIEQELNSSSPKLDPVTVGKDASKPPTGRDRVPNRSKGKDKPESKDYDTKEEPNKSGSRTIKRRLSAKGMLLRVSKKQKKANKTSTLERCEQKGLAKNRIKAWEENYGGKPETPDIDMNPTRIRIKSTLEPTRDRITDSSSLCCVCNREVYIVERVSAHGNFLHRECYKCAQCKAPLWIADSVLQKQPNGTASFYCSRHGLETSDDNVEGPTTPAFLQEDNTDIDSLMEFDVTQMMGMLSVDRGSTKVGDVTTHSDDAINMADTAVAEEEESDDEMTDEGASASLPGSANTTLRRKKQTFYSLANSVKLLVAHEIQRELHQTEEKETELEKIGAQMEKYLRSGTLGGRGSTTEEEIMTQWLEVVKEKQQLQNRQHQLMLKAKLFELEERHRQIYTQINAVKHALGYYAKKGNSGLESGEEKTMLTRACEPLETEMTDLEKLAKEITVYFDNGLLETEV